MGATHARPLQSHTNARGAISIVIGLGATACAITCIVTSNMIFGIGAAAVGLAGFALAWQAHSRALADTQLSKRSAIAGEALNFAPSALLIVWNLLIYTLAFAASD